jgi:hypothetical protein
MATHSRRLTVQPASRRLPSAHRRAPRGASRFTRRPSADPAINLLPWPRRSSQRQKRMFSLMAPCTGGRSEEPPERAWYRACAPAIRRAAVLDSAPSLYESLVTANRTLRPGTQPGKRFTEKATAVGPRRRGHRRALQSSSTTRGILRSPGVHPRGTVRLPLSGVSWLPMMAVGGPARDSMARWPARTGPVTGRTSGWARPTSRAVVFLDHEPRAGGTGLGP